MKNAMTRQVTIEHRFVEFVPEELDDGILYVTIPYATAVHKCCCGCGHRVVTPLSPTDWELSFNGKTVSLSPSIGNWSLKCRSHYWITRDQVEWARSWSQQEVEKARVRERREKERYYADSDESVLVPEPRAVARKGVWHRIRRLF